MEILQMSKDLQRELSNVVDYLEYANDDIQFTDYKQDFLNMAFSELIKSDKFSGMDGERRESLFNQYNGLCFLLETLDKFTDSLNNEIVLKAIDERKTPKEESLLIPKDYFKIDSLPLIPQ